MQPSDRRFFESGRGADKNRATQRLQDAFLTALSPSQYEGPRKTSIIYSLVRNRCWRFGNGLHAELFRTRAGGASWPSSPARVPRECPASLRKRKQCPCKRGS